MVEIRVILDPTGYMLTSSGFDAVHSIDSSETVGELQPVHLRLTAGSPRTVKQREWQLRSYVE